MPNYLFIYRNRADHVPAQGGEATAAWQTFLGHDLDGKVVDMGLPVFRPAATAGETGPDTVLSGYSIISADDLDAAAALAKLAPTVAGGGGVEVGELEPIDGM